MNLLLTLLPIFLGGEPSAAAVPPEPVKTTGSVTIEAEFETTSPLGLPSLTPIPAHPHRSPSQMVAVPPRPPAPFDVFSPAVCPPHEFPALFPCEPVALVPCPAPAPEPPAVRHVSHAGEFQVADRGPECTGSCPPYHDPSPPFPHPMAFAPPPFLPHPHVMMWNGPRPGSPHRHHHVAICEDEGACPLEAHGACPTGATCPVAAAGFIPGAKKVEHIVKATYEVPYKTGKVLEHLLEGRQGVLSCTAQGDELTISATAPAQMAIGHFLTTIVNRPQIIREPGKAINISHTKTKACNSQCAKNHCAACCDQTQVCTHCEGNCQVSTKACNSQCANGQCQISTKACTTKCTKCGSQVSTKTCNSQCASGQCQVSTKACSKCEGNCQVSTKTCNSQCANGQCQVSTKACTTKCTKCGGQVSTKACTDGCAKGQCSESCTTQVAKTECCNGKCSCNGKCQCECECKKGQCECKGGCQCKCCSNKKQAVFIDIPAAKTQSRLFSFYVGMLRGKGCAKTGCGPDAVDFQCEQKEQPVRVKIQATADGVFLQTSDGTEIRTDSIELEATGVDRIKVEKTKTLTTPQQKIQPASHEEPVTSNTEKASEKSVVIRLENVREYSAASESEAGFFELAGPYSVVNEAKGKVRYFRFGGVELTR